MNNAEDIDDLIKSYFSSGLHYDEILAFMFLRHGVDVSMSTLKRRLKSIGLNRKKNFSNISDIVSFISKELEKSGQLHGYRWMHHRCIQNKLVVTQTMVRIILKELDPEGVEYRRRRRLRRRKYATKGPNYIWHIDSYDKLKPYGIAISGAIDGFSRNVLWLNAGRTASNPRIIAGYFINTVKKVGGCPRRIRFDCGTENVCVEKLQHFFRETPVDDSDENFGEKSFIYGTSQCNQRIESWWSIMRKHSSQFWMNLFQQLKEDGHFTGSAEDKALIQFCFLKILQDELNQIMHEWNTHNISASKNAVSPKGRPAVMFELPELYNTCNYLCAVDEQLITLGENECSFFNLPCETDIFEICRIIIQEHNLKEPEDIHSAIDLFIDLKNYLMMELNTV